MKIKSLPLREVVSWNSSRPTNANFCNRLPLREVVSWNIQDMLPESEEVCLPLCEVVSWNVGNLNVGHTSMVYLCVR